MNTIKNSKECIKLKKELKFCRDSRRIIAEELSGITDSYEKGIINRDRYSKLLKEKKEGRTRPEWLDFCNNLIGKNEELIRQYKEENTFIRKLKNIRLDFRYSPNAINFKILGVIILLIAMISPLFFLKPTTMGFIAVEKSYNYTDKIDLMADSDREYYWFLENPGDLKSIKLDGTITTNGSARIYLEHNNMSYLIFDSSLLDSSGNLITGLVVLNESLENESIINETNQTTNETINQALENQTIINETNQDNETFGNGTFPNGLETNVSKTINKTITISLAYNPDTAFDTDDDGIETTDGIIDFTVADSSFNWAVDESRLCTKWETYSLDSGESTTVCYGNSDCCSFVELAPTRDSWNEVFYSNYERYGAGLNNIISTRIIYYNVSLDVDYPYAEILYSEWASLNATFYYETVAFEDMCIGTCLLDGFNETFYRLVINVSNGTVLNIDNIEYSISEEIKNRAPEFKKIPDFEIIKNDNPTINLSNYAYDPDNDSLTFSSYKTDNLTVIINDSIAVIIPDKDFVGKRSMFFIANDSFLTAVSNVFGIELLTKLPQPPLNKFAITNSSGDTVGSIDNQGNMHIQGAALQNQGALKPAPNSFILQNSSAAVIAYINSTGYLFLKGSLTEKAAMSASGTSLEIRNASDSLVAFFDNQGNLRLKGLLFENYANP